MSAATKTSGPSGSSKPAATAFAATEDIDIEEGDAWGGDEEYLIDAEGNVEV